jgi:hypothetical protein
MDDVMVLATIHRLAARLPSEIFEQVQTVVQRNVETIAMKNNVRITLPTDVRLPGGNAL